MMKDTIVISYYDDGFYWSFASGNRIYERDDLTFHKRLPEKILGLCKCLEKDKNFIPYINEMWPNCKRIIFCENGNITILNKGKGELFNAHK